MQIDIIILSTRFYVALLYIAMFISGNFKTEHMHSAREAVYLPEHAICVVEMRISWKIDKYLTKMLTLTTFISIFR